MIQHHHFSLKDYNTFGIEAQAKTFIAVNQIDELRQAITEHRNERLFFLGGGSNMLLTQDLDAVVIKLDLKGKQIVREDADWVWVEAQAGENWHEFVMWTLSRDYGGLENLSLIPGNVGTTPIQNIGAYGVEIKDHFVSCSTVKIADLSSRDFEPAECQFGYRESVFKNQLKDQYVITSVVFKLSKRHHQLKTAYGVIQAQLLEHGVQHPSIQDVSSAVIAIRQSKLPDPKELGNSGSFFKNPIVTAEEFKHIQMQHPEIPFYLLADQSVKIPAGWLIEQAGFKGKRFGQAGVHAKQALVLVNYGGATGREITDLAQKIQAAIRREFGIEIQAEVNII